MILSLPWLVIPIILYNIIAFSSAWPVAAPGQPTPPTVFNDPIFSLTMISGEVWTLTVGDFVVIVTLVVLFIELIKATRTGGNSIVDHALSMVLFIICIVEFLALDRAATSTFFIILFVALIDVVAGFSITIRAARRDFGLGTNP